MALLSRQRQDQPSRSGNRYPQALIFGYVTSIRVAPAVESPPELHGTVAQDKLSDRRCHGDGSQRQIDGAALVAEYTTAHPLPTSAYTERHHDRTATTRHLLQRK